MLIHLVVHLRFFWIFLLYFLDFFRISFQVLLRIFHGFPASLPPVSGMVPDRIPAFCMDSRGTGEPVTPGDHRNRHRRIPGPTLFSERKIFNNIYFIVENYEKYKKKREIGNG